MRFTNKAKFPLLLFVIFIPVSPVFGSTEPQVIITEATYMMGDGETPASAESLVLQKAKQVALEQAGTYVESYTKATNLDLTKEEIQTIAGGVIRVEVLEKSRTLVGDGVRFFIKIKATVTIDQMEELARRIKGRDVADQYNKLQAEYTRLTKELERWKTEMSSTRDTNRRETALEAIRQQERKFAEIQRNEEALLQRLVSGATLVAEAEQSKTTIDTLLQKLFTNGVNVGVGIPTSRLIGSRLDYVAVDTPINLVLDDQTIGEIVSVAASLGGETRGSDVEKHYQRVMIASDRGLNRYFNRRIESFAVTVTLEFEHRRPWTCIQIFPFSVSSDLGDSFLFFHRKSQWLVTFELAKSLAQQITGIKAGTVQVKGMDQEFRSCRVRQITIIDY